MDLEKDIIFFDEEITVDNILFENVLNESYKFAENLKRDDRQSIGYYLKERRAVKPKRDILLGKMGEFFTSVFINEMLSCPFSMPDFYVYNSKEKSWQEDLFYRGNCNGSPDINVKTCDSNIKRILHGVDLSWTFQKSNASGFGGKDAIYNRGGVVFFVYMERFDFNWAKICFSAPWFKIKDLLKDPVKEYLRGIKDCLYLSDVLNFKRRGHVNV